MLYGRFRDVLREVNSHSEGGKEWCKEIKKYILQWGRGMVWGTKRNGVRGWINLRNTNVMREMFMCGRAMLGYVGMLWG